MLANKGILVTMLARGLSAAVVAEIVASSGITNAQLYPSMVIVVIVVTVIISALGIPIFAKKSPQKDSEAGEIGGTPESP